jgi:hypothetical protein
MKRTILLAMLLGGRTVHSPDRPNTGQPALQIVAAQR